MQNHSNFFQTYKELKKEAVNELIVETKQKRNKKLLQKLESFKKMHESSESCEKNGNTPVKTANSACSMDKVNQISKNGNEARDT